MKLTSDSHRKFQLQAKQIVCRILLMIHLFEKKFNSVSMAFQNAQILNFDFLLQKNIEQTRILCYNFKIESHLICAK